MRQAQKLFQFRPEEGAALQRSRMLRRKIKGQRGQCIDDPKATHLLTVNGFDADDAHDDLGRHTGLLLGTLQTVLIVLPEFHAGLDANRLNEAAAVKPPVLRDARRWWQDQLGNLG